MISAIREETSVPKCKWERAKLFRDGVPGGCDKEMKPEFLDGAQRDPIQSSQPIRIDQHNHHDAMAQ